MIFGMDAYGERESEKEGRRKGREEGAGLSNQEAARPLPRVVEVWLNRRSVGFT